MGKRERPRRPARRTSFKLVKPLVLVVCEGAVTEKEYLEGFKRACDNPRVDVELREGQGMARTIIEVARDLKKGREKQAHRERDENLRYDEVWCVFDVDENPDLSGSKQMAKDNGLQLAISNPCIELWLWLHFAEQPGPHERHPLQKKLKKHLSKYNKHVDYEQLKAGYSEAVRRAEQLETVAEADGDPDRNPTTGMWRLTESIRTG